MRSIPTGLPFPLARIREGQEFGGLIRVSDDGMSFELDVAIVASLRISHSYILNREAYRRACGMAADLAAGTFLREPSVEPYVVVSIVPIGGAATTPLAWYWNGEGAYDGWSCPATDVPKDPNVSEA